MNMERRQDARNHHEPRWDFSHAPRCNVADEDGRTFVKRQQRILVNLGVRGQNPFGEAGNHRFWQAEILDYRIRIVVKKREGGSITSTLSPSRSLVALAGAASGASSGPFEAVETLLLRPGMVHVVSKRAAAADCWEGREVDNLVMFEVMSKFPRWRHVRTRERVRVWR